MKIRNIVTTVCTLTIVQVMNISVVEARGWPFHSREWPIKIQSSGTFISTPIDTNGDGLPASISMLEGKSKRFGHVTSNIVTEAQLALDADGNPVSCQTPDGKPGIINELVKANGVYRLRNGDQIFTEALSVNTCADLVACFDDKGNVREGCLFYGLAEATITGGTGRFSCASGFIEDTSTGLALVVDAKNQFFGAILESNVRGEINITANCDTSSPNDASLPK